MADSHLSIRIKNGPSKLDLMVALFHSPANGEKDHFVTFILNSGREVKVSIRGAVMMDNSRESWLIHGYDVMVDKYLKINFDTRTRSGKYTYVEPEFPTPHHYNHFSLPPSIDPKADPHLKPLFDRSNPLINKNSLVKIEPFINRHLEKKIPSPFQNEDLPTFDKSLKGPIPSPFQNEDIPRKPFDPSKTRF
jgi:hypothetical protein